MYMPKEPYVHGKRALMYLAKELYVPGKRGLLALHTCIIPGGALALKARHGLGLRPRGDLEIYVAVDSGHLHLRAQDGVDVAHAHLRVSEHHTRISLTCHFIKQVVKKNIFVLG